MVLTDKNIEELIRCEKTIIKPPKKNFYLDKTNHYSEQNDFDCKSTNNNKQLFHIFMRKNTEILDNFSIGLIYIDSEPNTKTLLLRVNGKQMHKNKEDEQSFYDYHVHKANEKQLSKNIENKFDAEICNEYSSFNSAFIYFCKKCAIIGYEKYFNSLMQISMEEL